MKIGLALGSGSARGWSHIGVINALNDLGIKADIVCGTSIGALVGASCVSDNLHKLEEWTCSLTKIQTARFFNFNSSFNGFVNTDRLHDFLNQYVASDDTLIEDSSRKYAAVATELDTGREMWLTDGPILNAVWSSMSLPGLFPAIKNNDKWLLDGGLVNPVPVSVCRALGADIVIAVNLNGDIVGKHFRKSSLPPQGPSGFIEKIADYVTDYTSSIFANHEEEKDQPPNLFDAIAGSVNIIQDRITRSRMAGDPPDILLTPKLSRIGLLEFYRAEEAIEEGKKTVERMKPELETLFDINR